MSLLLHRSFPLNDSASARLEIGIRIYPATEIETSIINKWNRRIILSPSAWTVLFKEANPIFDYYEGRAAPKVIQLDDKTLLNFQKIAEKPAIVLQQGNAIIYLMKNTFKQLCDLRDVASAIRETLNGAYPIVVKKIAQFKEVIKFLPTFTEPDYVATQISNGVYFNKNCSIDCELVLHADELVKSCKDEMYYNNKKTII